MERQRRSSPLWTYHSFPRQCCRRSRRSRRTPRTSVYSGRSYTWSATPRTLQTHKRLVWRQLICSGVVHSGGPVRSDRSDSRQLSSSLPSPQSFQPSHCSVLLRQRLLVHWNLPGQADQSHETEFHEPTGLEGFQRLNSGWMKRFRSVLRLVGTKVSYSAVKPWST